MQQIIYWIPESLFLASQLQWNYSYSNANYTHFNWKHALSGKQQFEKWLYVRASDAHAFGVRVKPAGMHKMMHKTSAIQLERTRRVNERRWVCVKLSISPWERTWSWYRCFDTAEKVLELFQIFQYQYIWKYWYFWQYEFGMTWGLGNKFRFDVNNFE